MKPMRRMDQERKRVPRAFFPLLAISLTIGIVCLVGLVWELYEQNEALSYYESMAAFAPLETETARQPVKAVGDTGKITGSTEEITTIDDTPIPLAEYPSLDFEALRESIPGIRAWISCEGTSLSYPVVQGRDNDYYLNRLPDGTWNKLGSIYMDYRNAGNFSDQNTLIYGHHERSGAMFGTLENYRDQAYYNEHPTLTLHTAEKVYTVELIAGYVVDAAQESLRLTFANADAFDKYIKSIRRRSVFDAPTEVTAEDSLLTLCTCTYSSSNARLVLVGKLSEAQISQ